MGAHSLTGAARKVFRLRRGGGRGERGGTEGWRSESKTENRGREWKREATERLGGARLCAYILVASSSENLPLLIKSGGLEESQREHRSY